MSNPTELPDLDLCPFCRGKARVTTENLDERYAYANVVKIQCESCGVAVSATGDTGKPGYADNSTTLTRAAAKWNRRAQPEGEAPAPVEAYMTVLGGGEPFGLHFHRAKAEAELREWEGAGEVVSLVRAHQAVAPGSLDADEMTRLRRLMSALGHGDAFVAPDDYVRGILLVVLGEAAGRIERGTSAPGTPEAPSQLTQALTNGIPLKEPVSISKALWAQREARAVLAGGKGPVAAVHLVNIGLTGWVHTKETAEAWADGYNTALKQYRSVLRMLAVPQRAAQLDGGQGEKS